MQLPLPAESVAVQFASDTAMYTSPVGVPAGPVTVTLTVTGTPTMDGSGVSAVIVRAEPGRNSYAPISQVATLSRSPSTGRVTWRASLAGHPLPASIVGLPGTGASTLMYPDHEGLLKF